MCGGDETERRTASVPGDRRLDQRQMAAGRLDPGVNRFWPPLAASCEGGRDGSTSAGSQFCGIAREIAGSTTTYACARDPVSDAFRFR
jgi:hypothetical protein